MQNIEEFKKIVNEYGLEWEESYIDENNMPWFTQKFLAKLFEVDQSTISRNIKELSELNEINLKSNMQKCISISTNKLAEHYDINVLYSLGMWLRSPRALEFRKNIIKLLEGIRTGELQVIDTKSVYNAIAMQPTSIYREKVNAKKLNNGVPELEIEVRTFNVKLNNTVKSFISSKGFPGSLAKIFKIIFKGVTELEPNEYRIIHNITNPNITREYCTQEEHDGFQFAEKKFYESCLKHSENLTRDLLYKLAKDAAKSGESFMELRCNYVIYGSSLSNGNQTSLFAFD